MPFLGHSGKEKRALKEAEAQQHLQLGLKENTTDNHDWRSGWQLQAALDHLKQADPRGLGTAALA